MISINLKRSNFKLFVLFYIL